MVISNQSTMNTTAMQHKRQATGFMCLHLLFSQKWPA